MSIYGYARVSTREQNLDSQIYALKAYGCDYIYKEVQSGSLSKRNELEKVIDKLKKGDTLVIFKLDRLSRGTHHLLELMEFFKSNDIKFVSIQNNIDTSTSMGMFFFTIMGAFAEMERELIRERVYAGIAAARINGKNLGRPPINKNKELVIELYTSTDLSISYIARKAEVSRATVYRYLRKEAIPLKNKTFS
uniref:recombinase family protein n=1 Tax=Brochothrix campestris TaxID=2757 RepID=UPI003D46C70C